LHISVQEEGVLTPTGT
nr:immunoglobulin heavy chain junction region [Mus musculus]